MKKNISRKILLFGVLAALALAISIGTGTVFATSAPELPEQAQDLAPNPGSVFEGLTQEQKDEIFAITDSIQKSREAVLDKLVEFGAIDQEAADVMKQRAAARYEERKARGFLAGNPMGRRFGIEGRPEACTGEGECLVPGENANPNGRMRGKIARRGRFAPPVTESQPENGAASPTLAPIEATSVQ